MAKLSELDWTKNTNFYDVQFEPMCLEAQTKGYVSLGG